MILILLAIIVTIIIAFAASGPSRSSVDEAEQKRKQEILENSEKFYPYGDDNMGRVISNIARDSDGGAQAYLDSIPAKKTYKTKKMGDRTYECVTWSEGGKDEE